MYIGKIGKFDIITKTNNHKNNKVNTKNTFAKNPYTIKNTIFKQNYDTTIFKGIKKGSSTPLVDFLTLKDEEIKNTDFEFTLFKNTPALIYSKKDESTKHVIIFSPDEIEKSTKILGKNAPIAYEKLLQIQDKQNKKTILHVIDDYKIINSIINALSKNAPKAIEKALFIKDINNQTPLYDINNIKTINLIIKTLGKKAPEIIEELLTVHKDNENKTILHNTNNDEKIEALANGLKDKAQKVYEDILTAYDENGNSLFSQNCTPQNLKTYAKILKDRAPFVFVKLAIHKNNKGNILFDEIYKSSKDKDTYIEFIKNYEKIMAGNLGL